MISKKKFKYSLCILFFLFFSLGVLQVAENAKYANASPQVGSSPKMKVIIDAGHGGVDGGAVASDGTAEKDINLQIALLLNNMLKMSGADTIMIRESDVSIHSPSAKTIRAKKTSDLHNRLSIMQENPDYIFVSIHQNTYSDSQYKGAQVFYSPYSSDSVDLAKSLQDSFSSRLQRDNKREIKKCTSDVFLIYNSRSTAVLCECGFMSNSEDFNGLKNKNYQKQLALCIYSGILDYYSST